MKYLFKVPFTQSKKLTKYMTYVLLLGVCLPCWSWAASPEQLEARIADLEKN